MDGFNLHIKGIHMNEFGFRCAICNKGFHHMWLYRGIATLWFKTLQLQILLRTIHLWKDTKKNSARCLMRTNKKASEICLKMISHDLKHAFVVEAWPSCPRWQNPVRNATKWLNGGHPSITPKDCYQMVLMKVTPLFSNVCYTYVCIIADYIHVHF